MKHIDFSILIDKFEMRLTEAAELEIVEHVAVCDTCRRDLDKVATFFEYVGSPGSESVPQAVTAHLLNIYQRSPVRTKPTEARSPGKAFLVFDDWAMAVNERFSGVDTRQLLFEIDQYTIDIRLELQGGNCRVSGQLFPERAGATISLSTSDHSVSSDLSDLGEFAFAPIPQAIYDITLSIGSEELSIPKVPLRR
ncbi:MAG: hypothetical protein ABL999_17545 [Pyrinomonadaceae bacterium]